MHTPGSTLETQESKPHMPVWAITINGDAVELWQESSAVRALGRALRFHELSSREPINHIEVQRKEYS